MKAKDKLFLETLLRTAGPSGAEAPVQRLLAEYIRASSDKLTADLHGNVVASRSPDAPFRIMLAAHADQVGFMIRYIDSNGFAFIEFVGGTDKKSMHGSHVVILSKQNGEVPGVIGKKATHLESSKEQANAPLRSDMWVDIGAASREEAEARIAVGDYAVFAPRISELGSDFIASPALDDRAGLFVAARAFRACKELRPGVGVRLVSTVQEELGGRGAATAAERLKPQIAIALDVTNASDDPGSQQKTQIDCRLGRGPTISSGPNTNPRLRDILVDCAQRHKIAYQMSPIGELESNDAKELQIADGGIATITLGLPNRNMHTQAEICSRSDLEATVSLVAAFLSEAEASLDLRPVQI